MRRQTVPRRKRVVRRPEVPDTKYKSRNVARFTSKLMLDGKRNLAERILYDAFDLIETKQRRPPLDVFEQALKNATPALEVKPRRVGGSTYQVPVEIRRDRGNALAMRWLIGSARARTGNTMAESNKAFAHYRW